ncbi:hypothetical protein P5V15_001815 [Pogonomyrmex californicus]
MDEDSSALFDSFFDPENLDKDKNLILDAECLLQSLEQCLSICAMESLDEQIFRKVLPKAHHFLLQIIEVINDTITKNNAKIDVLDNIKYKLQICDGFLAFWKKCVEHVSALEKVRAAYVVSLCDILPDTTKIIFEHCKASRKYGALLNDVMQELKNLFVKAGAIFKLFFATLNGVIVFDTDVQSETELLMKVIDAYGSIASIANGMDTKTFVELSEAFAKLAIVNQSKISPNNIATHIIRMAKDVSSLLSVIKDQENKNAERNVMVAMRLLRILEKLISFYNASLTHAMMSDLIELLAQIHGYSCSSLMKDDERTISINAASFLNVIFNHDDFKQAYFEYGRQIIPRDQYVHCLNYHLLTIAVMKKLNGMPYEHHWSLGSDSILDVAFIYIQHFEEELCVGDLQLLGSQGIGERPRLIGIYEATLVAVCNLVCQIPSEDFHALELLLLKYLLSDHFWSSLLSSDVWCFIGRLGSSQLCVDHIKYLIKVFVALKERRNSVEAIMLNNVIVRLYDLLNEDVKFTLLNKLINLDTDCTDASVLHLLIAKTKAFSLERSNRKFENLSKAFLDSQEHPSARNWKHLTHILSEMMTADYNDNKDVIDVLTKIWTFVAEAIIACEDKQLKLLSNFVVILFDATHLKSLHDDSFCAILTSIATLCVHLPSQGKIKVCHFLRRNVENLNRCKIQNTVTTLTGLFNRLLEDENPWVRQEALEAFEYVGHICPEQLVAEIAKALAKIPVISNVMQAYLSSRSYYIFKGFSNVQEYLRYLAKAIRTHHDKHICYEYNESEREEKMPKLEKENSCKIIAPKLTQLDEQAEELYKGLTKVLEDQAIISEAMCKRLITILEKILRVHGNENSQN